MAKDNPRKVRALFLSDIHLGSRAAKADYLLDFLKAHEAETIYLVGDIVDGWRLKRSWHWPQSHNDVVQKLLRKGRKGASIIYIAGNHDEFLRSFQGVHFGGIVVADRVVHKTADGRDFLIIHGDQFDAIVHNVRWLAYLGDRAYDLSVLVNRIVNGTRHLLGLPYWSFSSWAKVKVKEAVKFISNFQRIVVEEARRSEVQGVICGHIHHAAIEVMDGIEYVNTGDWVESCTAVVEHFDGRMEIIRWMDTVVRAAGAAPAFKPVVVGEEPAAA